MADDGATTARREPRLIDLHTDWLLQYAPETTLYGPERYPRVPGRLRQGDGYLSATSLAILSCYRNAEDWAARSEPWEALQELIVRIEAEFSGRLLLGPGDWERWDAEPAADALTWGIVGVEGFDPLIRTAADLGRLSALFERGVRLFQPVYNATSALAGSSAEGDERGLTDLGHGFLETLLAISPPAGEAGPRPIADLAHLNPRASGEVLSWFEADADRPERLALAYSHGTPAHPGFVAPRAITGENLRRLLGLGGIVGIGVSPPFFQAREEVRAVIESTLNLAAELGRGAVAIGTDFLGVDRVLPGLENAPAVVSWVRAAFDDETATALLDANARRFLRRALGVSAEDNAPH